MKSLLIAWNDFLIRIKDRRGIIMMLIMPLLLTAILGSALKNVFGEDTEFPETIVGLISNESDPLSESLKNEVLKKTSFVKLKTAMTRENLETMLKSGEIDVAVMIPSNWSIQLGEGRLQGAELLTDPKKQLKASVITSIIDSFIKRSQVISNTTNTVVAHLRETNQAASMEHIIETIQSASNQEVMFKETSIGEKSVSAMQYYTAAMAAMFLLFNVTIGAKSITKERESNTLARLRSAPISNTSIILGKFYGTFLFASIQFLLFYLATLIVFQVDWGNHAWQVIATGLAYGVAVAGISMILAAFITKLKTLDLISGVGVQIFALIGGSMLPLSQFPDALKSLSKFTPNRWALTGWLDSMSGVSWAELLTPIMVLLSIGIISLLIAILRLESGFKGGAK